MPEVVFVMSAAQHYPRRELAQTLGYELELQGVPSTLHLGWFPPASARTVYVAIDPKEYVRLEGEQAIPDDAVLRRTIFLCAEGPPSADDEAHIDLLKRAGAVFVLDQRTVIAMHRLEVPARLLRPGYSKSLDRFDPDAERPIDVMFLGAHSLRRTKYLSRAAAVLCRHNCLVQISESTPSPGGNSSFLAENRWPLLAQTKVVINLHRGDDPRLEWQRTLDAVHAGAVVVTEHSSGVAPLIPGEHLIVSSPEALPYLADALVRDPDRLAELRTRAYERLSTWVPYALWVSVLRAAVVELVGEPLPVASTETGPDETIPDATTPSETPPDRAAAASPAEPAASPTALLPVPVPADPDRRPVEIRHASPSWQVGRLPRLTVLIALPPDCTGLGSTLSSLAHSRLWDFEVVIVDAGAGERVLAPTADWLDARPRLAGCLLDPAVDRGMGAARNIGLDFARGPACLVLDPGQELYPRCLDVLAATLEAMPDMAFVYPIHEVSGAPDAFVEAGGDYLLSFLGWDPQRLRAGNHIHTPALVRTRHLRELGGFATDERLAGMEDYDLWCRMADRGWPGQLVPQMLARRPESGTSPALAGIHPSSGPATAALMERSPRLMNDAFATRVQLWRRRMKSPRSVR